MQAAELGYAIQPSRNGTFELQGLPREVILRFSSRASAVEQRLGAQGLTRASATLRQREAATLRSRTGKPEIDRPLQREQDRARARAAGLDLEAFVRSARERVQGLDATPPTSHSRGHDTADGRDRDRQAPPAALQAVREAARILSEREAAFTTAALEQRARTMSLGRAGATQIGQAIAALHRQGELAAREVRTIDPETRRPALVPGWTTAEMIVIERRMLTLERSGRGGVTRLLHRLDAQAMVGRARALAEEQGFTWTTEQARATIGVLGTSSRVVAIQGHAGTAKTTTVLATVAETARDLGYEIKAMAPTSDATATLAGAIGGAAVTVQRQVAELAQGSGQRSSARQLWIVDEASLVGARAMTALLAGAAMQNARMLLVGDEKQLGSVEAGRAFAQLQEAGMPTFRLTEIVRQTNLATREAVYEALRADAGRAMAAIERGGGQVVELKGATREAGEQDRRAFLARRYAELTPAERERTVLADPSREGRAELNHEVREALRARGELRGPSLELDILLPKGLTAGEQRHPVFYQRGDVVSFRRDLTPRQQDPLEKESHYTVVGIDQHGDRLQLQKEDGGFVTWRPGLCGARDVEVYRTAQRELAAGDRIVWTRNQPAIGAVNSQPGVVTAVDPRRGTFTIEQRGRRITLDRTAREARHLDHGYAQTAHKLQGRTADRALIHAEHWRLNLVNQRSFYVLVSRAKDGVTLVTSDRAGLIDAIRERSGERQAALDQPELRSAAEIARQAMQQTAAEREQGQARRQAQHDAVRERRQRPASRSIDLPPAAPASRDSAPQIDDDLGY